MRNRESAILCWSIVAATLLWSAPSLAFLVSVDEFRVNRNGSLFFTDPFNDGAEPPSGPNGAATYDVNGTIPSTAESGGLLQLNTANGALSVNALEQARITVRVRLLSNIDPTNLAAGLKNDDTLTARGIFSLTTPSGLLNPQYAVRFTDAASGDVHQSLQVQVRLVTATGLPEVRYIQQDFDANAVTVLGISPFTPPPGADEILLQIDRPSATSDDFFGSFAYVSGGIAGPLIAFLTPGQMFQGENFVRADFVASDGVLIAAVPEPGTVWLLALGALGLLASTLRSTRK